MLSCLPGTSFLLFSSWLHFTQRLPSLCLCVSGRSQCRLQAPPGPPLKPSLHGPIRSGSSNLLHGLLYLHPGADTEPGTYKVSKNSVMTERMNDPLLTESVLWIHFWKKEGVTLEAWQGEGVLHVCSRPLFSLGSLLIELRSLALWVLSFQDPEIHAEDPRGLNLDWRH